MSMLNSTDTRASYPPPASSQDSGSIRCATPCPKLKYTLTTIVQVVLYRREALSHYGNTGCGRMRDNRVLWRKFGSKRDEVNR